MKVFIRDVPQPVGEPQLRKFFRDKLSAFNCHVFEIQKSNKHTYAHLTLPDAQIGRAFLAQHGVPKGSRGASAHVPLMICGQTLTCEMDKHAADHCVLLSLQRDEADARLRASQGLGSKSKAMHRTSFRVSQLHCGSWQDGGSGFILKSCYQDTRSGTLIVGKRDLVILLNDDTNDRLTMRIDFPFRTIDSCTLGTSKAPSVTLSLESPPIISRLERQGQGLSEELKKMFLSSTTSPAVSSDSKRSRVSGLNNDHAAAVGQCLVYRTMLSDPEQLEHLQRALKHTGGPGCMTWPTSVLVSARWMPGDMKRLADDLPKCALSNGLKLPFTVMFQLERLATNAFLSPKSVTELLHPILQMTALHGDTAVSTAIYAASNTILFVSPGILPEDVSSSKFLKQVEENISKANLQTLVSSAQSHAHLGWVHRVYITPCGMYLEGPQLETLNRVLRKYASHSDQFLRVTFCDEDEGQVALRPEPTEVYEGRFKQILEKGIPIAGRQYIFLGFSHSSLKAGQAWFMAPFVFKPEGGLIHAQKLIKNLGDFRAIRNPARCAARIGQTFTDATHTIRIRPEMIREIPDVKRNNRVFTDGCATISQGLLSQVWRELRKTKKRLATVLQIRFQGAKGVLSLDPTLPGDMLCLRESMIKFRASPDLDLEICGAAYSPLPMYLNQQLITLLEALGVDYEHFSRLQTIAVKRLEATSRSPINASKFLDVHGVNSGQIPDLLLYLNDLRRHFREDSFLARVVDLTLLVHLRDIKYRARIPVDNAYNLYGIADETGFLREGQVYISIRRHDGEKVVLQGRCVVTRSPALHPGDIQIVEAVDVPANSRLKSHHNCITFSQRGDRDLPSMLSGGDLDGDIFHCIFEPTLFPQLEDPPADYLRPEKLDIGREVTAADMQSFFLTFMQNDKLGIIARSHLQCADQLGPRSKACKTMAQMHSTAVDFAKTGIPVDMQMMPYNYATRAKPDFMAPSSRLLIKKAAFSIAEAQRITSTDIEEDAVLALEPDRRPPRFYPSERALGELFRAIDDEQFLNTIQCQGPVTLDGTPEIPLMEYVWDWVQRKAIPFRWHQHQNLALEIRDTYNERLVNHAYNFSPDGWHPLTELEVFTGIIVGRDGQGRDRRVRQSSAEMKESFSNDIAWAIEKILKGKPSGGDDHEDPASGEASGSESLERSIAAFAIAMTEETTHVPKMGTLVSFKYVAAATCLGQMRLKFHELKPL